MLQIPGSSQEHPHGNLGHRRGRSGSLTARSEPRLSVAQRGRGKCGPPGPGQLTDIPDLHRLVTAAADNPLPVGAETHAPDIICVSPECERLSAFNRLIRSGFLVGIITSQADARPEASWRGGVERLHRAGTDRHDVADRSGNRPIASQNPPDP